MAHAADEYNSESEEDYDGCFHNHSIFFDHDHIIKICHGEFNVDDFMKEGLNVDFNKFNHIQFFDCFIKNDEYTISELTRVFGAGLIIEGMFPFKYITTEDDTGLPFYTGSFTSYLNREYMKTSLWIDGMTSNDIPLFLLKLKHGMLVTENVCRRLFDPIYILIDTVEFTNSHITEADQKYLDEEISKSKQYMRNTVPQLG